MRKGCNISGTMPETTAEHSLRDIARNAVREEVLRQAWNLFASQGFEATTIDQVVEAAGMSRRTFFRYFSGKDELLLERLLESGQSVADALARRPDDESAWHALRAAFDVIVISAEANAEPARRLQLMLRDEPGVRSSLEEKHRRWVRMLAPLVERHLPGRGGSALRKVEAVAVAASALSCLSVAQNAWTDDTNTPLSEVLDAAMNAVHPLDHPGS